MHAAVYTDDVFEQQQIGEALKQCGMEQLHSVKVMPFADYKAFCHALTLKRFDLLVIAQSGTFSLELMDAIHLRSTNTPVIWFSDLDFAVRSYEYGVIWFGKKPVELPVMRKAFQRLLEKKHISPMHLAMND